MQRSLIKPTKSVYKGAAHKGDGGPWTIQQELTKERVLSLFCIILLPVSLGLYLASITGSRFATSSGDGLAILSAHIGYRTLCFTPTDGSGEQCATISASCSNSFSAEALQYQQTNYGTDDSTLAGCTEWNAFRAFHVLAIIWCGIALITMTVAHFRLFQGKIQFYFKIVALLTAFGSGVFGLCAQCISIDWLNLNQQYIVALGYENAVQGDGSTSLYVQLGQSSFDEVGGWVAAMASGLIYIVHFPTTLAK